MKYFPVFFCFIALCIAGKWSFAQDLTQTIRGKVVDKELLIPLAGANVVLLSDTSFFTGTITDIDGNFRLENISLGRHRIKVSYLGYHQMMVPDIILSSGKEKILNIELEESATEMETVVVRANRKEESINEMSIISARLFSVEETDRYAGSRSDPARMASNFAGVQGADDSRNDVIIRGNSPLGVLWRLEGVNIPNPNHFSILGTTGGAVNIINNKSLANSDFITSAFAAEYGNSTSGVFDIRFRNGNNEKHEFTGQFGFLGTELAAEGPISRERGSSFMVNYRYSTLAIFNSLKIDIGTSAIPKYQDASFKINFPDKSGSNISLFGMGGISDIEILISNQTEIEREIYGEQDKDQYFGTSMGVLGMSYTKALNPKSFLKATISYSIEEQHSYHEQVYRHIDVDSIWQVDSLVPYRGYVFKQGKSSASFYINKKFNRRNMIKYGLTLDNYHLNFDDSVRDLSTNKYINRLDHRGNAALIQPFIQFKHKLSDDFIINAGIHSQYFTLNNSASWLEPRLGLKWKFGKNQSLSTGFGIHSQIQPTYIYFHHIRMFSGELVEHNRDIGFSKSNHYVLAYDNLLSSNLRLKIETYYQQLYDIPVEIKTSSYSIINQGVGFSRFFPDSLQNTGTGQNYGIEMTIEKFFANNYFFMITGSLYQSKYEGSDGVSRDTDFNGNYIFNFLAAKEFKLGKKSVLSLGGKVTTAGGKRYGPVDTLASSALGEIIYIDSTRNSWQLKDYFRADVKINYRINAAKVTHEIGLDLINFLGIENILKLTYAPDPLDPNANAIREEYQLGFLPLFYYKVDF